MWNSQEIFSVWFSYILVANSSINLKENFLKSLHKVQLKEIKRYQFPFHVGQKTHSYLYFFILFFYHVQIELIIYVDMVNLNTVCMKIFLFPYLLVPQEIFHVSSNNAL